MSVPRLRSGPAWVRRIDLDTFKSTLFELSDVAGVVTVGRRDADIVIDSPRLSKKQCAFVSDGGRWLVEDATMVMESLGPEPLEAALSCRPGRTNR